MPNLGKGMVCAAVMTAFGGSSVWAASCPGVEGRVNIETSQLQSAVLAHISERTSALVAQEQMERQQLLSALKVFTRQLSTSASQEIMAEEGASKAFGQVIVEQSVADQTRKAVEIYGNTGYNACGIVEAANSVAEAQAEYKNMRDVVAERITERHYARTQEEHRVLFSDWADLMQNSDDLTANALFEGGENAEDYIDMMLGPPRSPAGGGEGALSNRLDRVEALKSQARASVSAMVMSDIASNERVDEALRDVTSQWVGEDGGEAWAAKQAASGSRAVLLDTARLEAANLAITANAYKRASMEEFALATFALSYVDRMLKGGQQ